MTTGKVIVVMEESVHGGKMSVQGGSQAAVGDGDCHIVGSMYTTAPLLLLDAGPDAPGIDHVTVGVGSGFGVGTTNAGQSLTSVMSRGPWTHYDIGDEESPLYATTQNSKFQAPGNKNVTPIQGTSEV